MTRERGAWSAGTARRARRASLAAFLIALAVGSSACGAGVDSARPTADGSPSTLGSGGVPERITPAGVAAVVSDHLGQGAVRRFATYDPEEGSVGVLVDLRGGDRADHFIVSVWSPDQQLGGPEDRSCRSERAEALGAENRTCRKLDDGTIVEVFESEAFSDDNTHGFTLRGTAIFPEGGAALAMYESYDRSAPLASETLAALLSDPRLRWLTDPSVNATGATIEVERLRG
jgi:hypothetical protein